MLRFSPLSLALLLLFVPVVAQGQPVERTSTLTVDQIMQDPETWVGDWPSNPRWHEDGDTLYFDWNPNGEFASDSLYQVPRQGGTLQKVSPEERRLNPPRFDGWHHGEHVYTDDFARKVYAADGDLYLYNRETDAKTRLTDTRAVESTPRFDPAGERVIFRRDENLFALTLSTGLVRQLTNLRSGAPPQDEAPTAQEAFLEEQQTALFETLAAEKEEREAAEAAEEREQAATDPPPPFHYGDTPPQQLRLSPSGRFVSFTQETEPSGAEPTVVADYVTLSGFADVERARPKVGIPPSEFSLHLQDLRRDTTYTIDLHQLPGTYDVPQYLEEKGVEQDSSEAQRALYSYGPYWSPDGEHAVLVVRTDDNKDRWIAGSIRRLAPSPCSIANTMRPGLAGPASVHTAAPVRWAGCPTATGFTSRVRPPGGATSTPSTSNPVRSRNSPVASLKCLTPICLRTGKPGRSPARRSPPTNDTSTECPPMVVSARASRTRRACTPRR